MTEHTFNNWRDLLAVAPQQKRLALVMLLMDFDGYAMADAVEYVKKLSDDAVRSEILEHQTWRKLLQTDKNNTL